MKHVRRRTWTWWFDSPVERIWRCLADTARFNEAAGLPKHDIRETPRPDGSVQYIGTAKLGWYRLEWEEEPVNWIANQWFQHRRHFLRGPFKLLCATLILQPEGNGCRAQYTLEVVPRNVVGRVILATGFFRSAEKTFSKLADNARDFAWGRRATPFQCRVPKLQPRTAERVRDLVSRIEATPHGHGLASKLADYVLTRQEVDIWLIRPLRLAREWNVPDRYAVEVCLEAVKQGLLRLRWDLLCPRCQVGKESAPALDQLPKGAHCGTCNIDYARDYSNNVELAFHPAKAIRPLRGGEYCLFGPISTPHIRLHLTLPPGQTENVCLALEPGVYRLRTLEPGDEATIEWREGGFPKVVAHGNTIMPADPCTDGEITLENRTERKLTFIVEERAWIRDALTARRATALQAFRDLFNEEVLRPGDDVEIDHIALMFTDLKGSTALYHRIGDPQAYALVREHYAIIGRAVRRHSGAIVKTIGDAVMGAFADPADAFRCALQLHDDFDEFSSSSGKEPVIIKVGLHVGRCISVTLNNRLDYYGSAANKAARLESQSRGGDIVVSSEFAADAAVASLLRPFALLEEEAMLRGFDGPVPFFRITAEEVATLREEKRGHRHADPRTRTGKRAHPGPNSLPDKEPH